MGCVCHRELSFLFVCSNLMYILEDRVGDICDLSSLSVVRANL